MDEILNMVEELIGDPAKYLLNEKSSRIMLEAMINQYAQQYHMEMTSQYTQNPQIYTPVISASPEGFTDGNYLNPVDRPNK